MLPKKKKQHFLLCQLKTSFSIKKALTSKQQFNPQGSTKTLNRSYNVESMPIETANLNLSDIYINV